VVRSTYLPGWQWSKHVKPIVKTDSCEVGQIGYIIEGHLKVVMDDDEEAELEQGDFVVIPAGHDAWVVGDEPVIMIDWSGYQDYAMPPEE
jgi:quercetin dioxygenase-like cupin family protein